MSFCHIFAAILNITLFPKVGSGHPKDSHIGKFKLLKPHKALSTAEREREAGRHTDREIRQ